MPRRPAVTSGYDATYLTFLMTHDALSEEAVFDGLEDLPVQNSDLLRVGEYFFTCVLEVADPTAATSRSYIRVLCTSSSHWNRECGNRGAAALPVLTVRQGKARIHLRYSTTVSMLLVFWFRSLRLTRNHDFFLRLDGLCEWGKFEVHASFERARTSRQFAPTSWLPTVVLGVQFSAAIRTTPFDDGQEQRVHRPAALLRQRDTCTLVSATEAHEGPNTQDGIERFMGLRRQRNTPAWC